MGRCYDGEAISKRTRLPLATPSAGPLNSCSTTWRRNTTGKICLLQRAWKYVQLVKETNFIKVTTYMSHGSVVHCEKRTSKDLRWKSQRIKIHRLQISVHFKFIPQGMVFFGNHKHLAKVSRLLVYRFFDILVWIFLWFFGCFGSVTSMFSLKLLLIFWKVTCAPKKSIG